MKNVEAMGLKTLKLALVQMQSSVGDIDANLKKMLMFIDRAAEENADIICFPEASLTGYSSDHGPDDTVYDCGLPVGAVRNAACANDIIIVFGFMEKKNKGLPYLTQLTICPDGTSMKYRKTHLGTREAGRFTEGDSIDVLDTEKTVIGVALCWEAHMPDIFTVLRRNGAELIVIPHASNLGGGRRKETWMRYLPARAWDNDVYIAACNSIGDNGRGSISGGGSIVLNKKGIVIFENFNGTESLDIVELDGSDRDDVPSEDMCNIKYFRRRRPELYR
jgi:predicted amidohydrolase